MNCDEAKNSRATSIAILGGTFDPIHNAHLELAHVLHETLQFQHILFIPCRQNPLKANVNTTTQQRIDMIQLAINPFPNYYCDLREIHSQSPLYTLETFQSLRKENPTASIAFSLGMDSLNDLEKWAGCEAYLNYVHFIVFPRPNYTLNATPMLKNWIETKKTTDIQDLHAKTHGCIYFSPIPENTISSTNIRNHLKNKDMIFNKAHLPASVFQYIQDHHLY